MSYANDYDQENDDGADDRSAVSLSPRQRQILILLKAGKTNKDISAELGIGVGTVKQHLVTLFRKLGVTNRSMAVAKSLTMAGLDIDGPTSVETDAEDPADGGPMLERRPVAVLSLEAIAGTADPDDADVRDIYKVFAEVAFDFGAVFLSHRGRRCDMVFGVRRVRRHDVLRAIRAAMAVSEDLSALLGVRPTLRAGLAFGYIFASTDASGEWTGEAIGGPVVSAARGLLAAGPAGSVTLHDSVRGVIRNLGIGAPGGIPTELPLERSFRWQRRFPKPVATLHGRVTEMQTLRGHLLGAKRDSRNIAVVQGESGMGKSALASGLTDLAAREGIGTETWICSIPDSQPGSPSVDRLESGDTGEVLTIAEFVRRMADADATRRHLVVIEDCHLLRTEMFALLSASFNQFDQSGVLAMMTYRGRAPLSPIIVGKTELIHLGHIPEEKQQGFVDELLGPGHEAAEWVRRLARGVPRFVVGLAAYVKSGEERGRSGPGDVPPAQLSALIAERIEAHNVDRRLLYLIARGGREASIETVLSGWRDGEAAFQMALEIAVEAGVVVRNPGGRRRPDVLQIAHPLVRWVMAAAFQHQDQSFG